MGTWVVLGSLGGLVMADAYVKKSGKQSIFVWLLVIVFIIAAIVTPFVAYSQLSDQVKNGESIMAFYPLC